MANRQDIASRASKVSGIFRVLASVVAILGGLLAGLMIVVGLSTVGADDALLLFQAMLMALAFAVGTAVLWAQITLASVLAGYVAVRLSTPTSPTQIQPPTNVTASATLAETLPPPTGEPPRGPGW